MSLLARVAKWQTRWLQVPVFERTWGFKSPLAHHIRLCIERIVLFTVEISFQLAENTQFGLSDRSASGAMNCRKDTSNEQCKFGIS
jgi:hypothetical protein